MFQSGSTALELEAFLEFQKECIAMSIDQSRWTFNSAFDKSLSALGFGDDSSAKDDARSWHRCSVVNVQVSCEGVQIIVKHVGEATRLIDQHSSEAAMHNVTVSANAIAQRCEDKSLSTAHIRGVLKAHDVSYSLASS